MDDITIEISQGDNIAKATLAGNSNLEELMDTLSTMIGEVLGYEVDLEVEY